MPLLQPSFRGRLRLFFAVIVIVPMVAVGLVLFQLLDASGDYKLDSGLDQAQKTAKALYQDDRQAAIGALEPFRDDRRLATAIEKEQAAIAQRRITMLAHESGAAWLELEVNGWQTFRTGSPAAIAAARADLRS